MRLSKTTTDPSDAHAAAPVGTADGELLQALGLGVRYGGVHALREVDLVLRAGELCGVIGPNGAGKTTLFDVISGHRTPTGGRLLFGGDDITDRSAVWRARHGMRRTFQRQQVFGALSVEDNLLAAQDWHRRDGGMVADVLGLQLGRRHRRERAERTAHVLELCGLTELRAVPAGRLPIGTARVVELARAVVDRPRVLLLDEPSSGLGSSDTEQMATVIAQLRDETGCAVLLVEHDMAFVMDLCDRVVVLDLGSVLAEGTPAQVQAHAGVRSAYLG